MSDGQSTKQETKVIRFTLAGKKLKVRIEGDLELATKSKTEIVDQLNRIPGNLAYWGAKKAQVESMLDSAILAEQQWSASKYFSTLDALGGKATEKAIQNKIIVDHGDKYMELKTDIRELTETTAILKGILKAYEQQVWCLRAIVEMHTSELRSMMSEENLSKI